eukprot:409688_1
MNALVFGSDLITVGSLRHLIKCSAISHLELVTPKSNKKSPPIKFCNETNIQYHCLPSNIDFKLTNWDIPNTKQWDIGILVSFGYLIPSRIISLFPNGMINVHPSLLPQYIGSAPIPYSLLNGDKITGVSIIDVSPQLDSGNILSQRLQIIDKYDTYDTLSHKLAELGGQTLCDTVTNLKKYRENSIKQSDNENNIKLLYKYEDAIINNNQFIETDQLVRINNNFSDEKYENDSFEFKLIKTKKINKNMSFIDWRLSAKQIFNRYRTVNGLLKNSRCLLGTKGDDKLLVLIDEIDVYNDINGNIFNDNDNIGTIVYCKENDILFVKCGDNNNELLGIKKLRIAPSLSTQHLPNFHNFINEFGHFIPYCDSKEYSVKYNKHLKNHF